MQRVHLGHLGTDRAVIALGLAAVTVLGALAIPSSAWVVPVLAIAALVLVPRSDRGEVPALSTRLLHAALGASLGLAYMLVVLEL